MDRGGSFRTPQPDRRVINRSEPAASRQQEQPDPIIEEQPRPVQHRASAPRSTAVDNKKASKAPLWIAAIIVVVVIIGALIWVNMANNRSATTAIDGSKYQAVLLSNGESYFGKLTVLNDDFMKMTDIYYLKAKSATANSEDTTTTDGDFQLIKFGGEVQGPEDEMVISKAQILYYENLKPDGKASKAIEQYKSSK